MNIKFILLMVLSLTAISACNEKTTYQYPFQNPDLSLDERVNDLIGRLTIEEKVGQMMNSTPAIERLGIPQYDWWNEALHGVARAGRATVFPQAIAMASTFDEDAILQTFTVVSDEARAKYHEFRQHHQFDRYSGLTFWTPNINIFRDPRWGRGMETYGEDPYLTSRLGLAVVKGLQGNDPQYFKTHACAKHYAVHSGPEWNRHEYNAVVSPRDLYTTYLPAFETLVKEGNVQEVMCAYNRYEGKPCCGSDKLLVDILRNAWGYDRIVVSDCGAIDDFWHKGRHETHSDRTAASIDAVRMGTDVECGGSYQSLIEAVKKGEIKEAELDISLRRLFTGRFRLGMFDPDNRVSYSKIPYDIVECPEHIALAHEMACKSAVLLKNGTIAGKKMLPLNKNIRKIAVVGPNAADSTMLWANYNGFPSHTVTILEGIRNKIPDAEVIYELGCNHTDNLRFTDFSNCLTSDGQAGLTIEFFNNLNLEGKPVYKGNFSNIHFSTGGDTQFAPGVNLFDFSARLTGEFVAPETDNYAFDLAADDGYRLYIDNQLVLDCWQYGSCRVNQYSFNAEKGKSCNIKIEYNQQRGGAHLDFTAGTYKPVEPVETATKVQDADVIIFVGGLSPRLEGEEMPVLIDGFKKGDRTDIELPKIQREMLKALKATGKPIVFVVCTGSAIALDWEDEHLDAILNAWYGGQEAGTAVADILFGDYNPSGRLPITFYRSTSQLPDFENYDMQGRTYRYMTEKPLYPFGYGLSYTAFSYGQAQLSASQITTDGSVTITIPVTNDGQIDGDEIVQLYVQNPNDPKAPLKALKGIRCLSVAAGQTTDAVITLEAKAFESFDDNAQTMEVRPGKYGILYGASSDNKALKKIDLIITE